MDYPMEENINNLIEEVRSKTLCEDFDEQIEIAEELYGQQISLEFTKKDVKEILDMESYYPQEYKERVFEIIMNRRRKYRYLFWITARRIFGILVIKQVQKFSHVELPGFHSRKNVQKCL